MILEGHSTVSPLLHIYIMLFILHNLHENNDVYRNYSFIFEIVRILNVIYITSGTCFLQISEEV